MSADARAASAPDGPEDTAADETLPPMSALLAAGAAAEAVCTPPRAPEAAEPDDSDNSDNSDDSGGQGRSPRRRDAA